MRRIKHELLIAYRKRIMKNKKDPKTPPYVKPFEEILHEVEIENELESSNDEDKENLFESELFTLTSAVENEILMHRDAHFGGNFAAMLDYYRNDGKGVQPGIFIPNIEKLALMEKESGQNLASLLLTGAEAEKVARARDAYKKLRELYEKGENEQNLPILVADLILSEEEEPVAEMARLIEEKSKSVPLLMDLIRSEEFHDPLFPGYGLAPAYAAECLGKIGDKRALITLFEAIGEGDFFSEEALFKALKSMGDSAKQFLLKVMHSRPLNQDNERAALALLQFKEDPEVSAACFEELQKADVLKNQLLATYLTFDCEGLQNLEQRDRFIKWAKDPTIPKLLKNDIETVIKSWKE